MATLHILHGLPGSGKSTFAKELERKGNVLIFSNDEWMNALFPDHCPREVYLQRVNVIESLQLTLAKRALACGVDVVWDYGVWTKASRLALIQYFASETCRLHFYAFECDPSVADARVLTRETRDLPSHHLNQEALDLFRSMWEPISPEEGLELTTIRTDGA